MVAKGTHLKDTGPNNETNIPAFLVLRMEVCCSLRQHMYDTERIGLPWWLNGKESNCNAETWIWSLGQKYPLEKEMATNSVFFPGKFHLQRSLASYSLWSHKRVRQHFVTKQQRLAWVLHKNDAQICKAVHICM